MVPCDLLAAERDAFEALDLAHHLLDSRPRLVEDLCEELLLAGGVRAIGDDRTNAAFTRRLPVCLRIIALVRDNGAGIDIRDRGRGALRSCGCRSLRRRSDGSRSDSRRDRS